MHQALSIVRQMREAAARGDYAEAVTRAAELAPGKERLLEQFRLQMERYEKALAESDRRRALLALAKARSAAVAADLPALESIASERLAGMVNLHGGRDG